MWITGISVAPLSSSARAEPTQAQGMTGASGSTSAPLAVGYEEHLITTPVTVEDVDKKNRTLTVRTADEQKSTVKVPPDVQRFDQLKKGDKIDLAYYRAVAVSVVPAHTTASAGGQKHQMTATPAQVVTVNKSDNSMQVKGQNGKTQTVGAADDSVRQKMQTLKPGDVVELIYSEAEATSILPHTDH